jgi:hypothetical protein
MPHHEIEDDLRHSFSAFPDGSPGQGLLLLRVTVGLPLVYWGIAGRTALGFAAIPEFAAAVLGYHLKTGHTLSLQNRPTDFTQDTKMLYRAGCYSGKSFFDCRRPRSPRRGIAQGGFQRSALKSLLRGEARCLRRGGNRPRPGLPLGETGKGDQIPCCRRLTSFWFGIS